MLLVVLIEAAAIADPRLLVMLLVMGPIVVAAPGPWLRPVMEIVAAVVEDAPAKVFYVALLASRWAVF